MSKRQMRSTIRLAVFIAGVLFITGILLVLYPKINEIWTDRKLQREVDIFFSYVETTPCAERDFSASKEEKDTEYVPEQYPELWVQMHRYNEVLLATAQAELSDEASYARPSFILADFGLKCEIFAVLSIPKLELTMPVYLGATARHMADGAAQMTATSLPIGGSNTNCVIAGHRGWNGAPYFLYIPTLEVGDEVTITNLWETLTYQVVEMKIISPTDVDAIRIQPGRDLLTLLTCHPPATGGRQRYLVFCERVYP